MTLEKRVEYLEDKLYIVLEVLKLMVEWNNGLNAKDTDWLLKKFEELQQQED